MCRRGERKACNHIVLWALMRFEMTFDITLRDDSSLGKLTIRVIKNVSFSLLLLTFSIKANFEKDTCGNPSA